MLASVLLAAVVALAAGSISADPDSIDFGSRDVDDGPTLAQPSTITNAGPDPVSINSVELHGLDTDQFAVDQQPGDCDGSTVLAANESCDVHVTFHPTATGPKSATLKVISLGDGEATVALSGQGTHTELTADPDSLPFGSQDVADGATAVQTSVVENTGTETVDLDAVTLGGTDPSDFARLTDQGTDCTATTTLTAGQTCDVRVEFDPATTGSKTATVTVDSNAADETIALSGTGTQTELTAAPDSLAFGSQDVDAGQTDAQTSVVENTGTEAVTFSGITVDAGWVRLTGQPADCATNEALAPTEECDLRIAFDPTATGAQNGQATISSNAPDETVAIDGTGTQTELTASPATLSFGSQDVNEGPTATQESTVTNTGTEPVSVAAVTATGDTGHFQRLTGLGSDCTSTTTLAAGEDCRVRVRFDPSATGLKSATYSVESNAPDADVDTSGTGTLKELTPDPATLPFGAQDVDAGATAEQASTVTNTGDQPVTIAAVTIGGANPKQFQRLTGDPADCAAATTLQPLEDCTVRAVFDPSFKGAKSATITVDSNAPDATVGLTGSGIEAVYESSDDPLDEGHVTNGQVNAVAFDSAGRTYLGGTFTFVGPRTGHGVELSESSDEPASGFPDVNGTIRTVAPDGSGGWFIGGDFTSVGGVPRSRLAHIEPSGALDAGWDPSADGRVNALAVSPAGVFAGGEFAEIDGVQRAFVAKLSASTGAVDPDWHPIVDNRVRELAVDGTELYLGGEFTQIGGETRNRLGRVSTAAGASVDALWNPDADGIVHALAVSGTDVYVGGSFTTVSGETRSRIAKLTGSAGAPDPAWNPGADHDVLTLALSGSDLYAGGAFTTIGGQSRGRAAKLSAASGAVDGTFNPAANAAVHALAISGAGVYAAGEYTQIGGQSRARLARLATGSGSADGWDPSANGAARAIALAGTDVYAGGDFTSVGASARNRLARLEPDGTLDGDWNPNANNTVSALVVAGSDVYVGGSFTSVGGQPRNRIAKLSVTGSAADATWNPGASGTVSALAVSGTTVYAGGLFVTIDGQSRARLAKLTGAAGDLDTAWAPAGAGGQVNALALSGSDLFAGGLFTTIGGQSRSRIAKLDAGGTGAVDTGWDPGASSTVTTLAVSGADLYAGGFFSTIGGQPRNFAAQLDTASGTVDPAWDPSPNSIVRALALSATDVYMGGDFTLVGDQPHSRLAKLPKTGAGTADAGWAPELTGGNVLALAVSGDRLAAGGSFTAVGGQSSQGFALLELATLAADPGGLGFGERDVDDGPTATLTSTITNPRAETITLSAVSLGGADASQFARLTGNAEDCVAGTVLDQNETCEVRARFDPTSAGAKSASIGIVSNSPGIEVALTGSGVQTALSPDPGTLAFGDHDIDEGETAIQTSTVTNAGTEQVDFSSVALGGTHASDFERLSDEPGDCVDTTILQPSQTCTLRARFDPATVGEKSATLTIESTADDVEVALSGTGIQTLLTRSPDALAFGPHDIDDGATATQTSTVTNAGTETVTLVGVDTTGHADQFVRLTDQPATDCAAGTVLDAGETCELRERFDPTTVGAKAANVTVDSDAADVTVALSGTGTQTQLTAEPDSLAYGSRDVDDGPTAAQESVVTNTGTESVTVAAVNVTGDAAHFVRLTDEGTDCSASDVLAPGATCKVRVEFDPGTAGAKSATVTVDSNAPDETVGLSGSGIQTELSRSPASLAFGSRDIDDGDTEIQESTVTNSGTETVDLDAVTVGGADPGQFEHVTGEGADCTAATTLTAGQTCKLRVRFDPSTTGAKAAAVTVESNAADVTLTLTGTGTQTLLERSPDTLAFGNQNINEGPSAAQEATVTNAGSESVTFTAIDTTGDTTHFERLTGQPADCTASTTLAAGETCKLRARFDPAATGAKAATITVESNAADVSVALSGTGVLTQLSRSEDTLAFGSRDVDDGATATEVSTITNSGSETVTFTSVAMTGDTTEFVRLTDQPGTDCAGDTVLTAGETCDVRVAFDPTAVGAKSATVTIQSDAADQAIALTGTGTQTLLTRDPTTLSFGSQDLNEGATATQESTVTNAGSEPVSIVAVNESGDADGEFERLTGEGTDCTGTTSLSAGETCKIRVRFDPVAEGARSATYTVDSNAADVAVVVDGTGILKELTADDASFSFGSRDVDDGPAATQDTVVTNTGTESLTIAAVDVTGDTGHFARLTDEPTDCSAGDVLAPDDTCNVRAQFDPATVGAKSATITIDSNAPDETVGLTGTGIQTELSRSPTSLTFGSQDIDDGPTTTQASTVTNSGTETVDLDGVTVGGADPTHFEQVTGAGTDCTAATTLAAGATCELRLRFDPSTMGAKGATVTVESNAADVSVTLSGTGIQTLLERSPDTLAFGSQDVDDGATATQTSTVTNAGTETVDLDAVGLTGDSGHFERLTSQGTDCTAATTLTAGQTCELRLRFDPATVGAKAATVTVDSNAADVTVALTGTGTQTELTSSPAALLLGSKDVDDGATATQTSTVTNTGTESVTIVAVALAGDTGDFAHATGGADDCAAGNVLAAGDTCEVRLGFDPGATGAKAITATIDSNAPDATVTATGTGIQTELSRSPISLSFGARDIDEGPTAAQEATVTNSGTEPVSIAGLETTGQFERLTGQGTDCTTATTLTAGQTCKLRARFDPSTTGAKTGTITVDSNAADVSVDLSGTGTQTLLARSPASLSFGSTDVDDGPTAVQVATVTNTGSETVDLDAVTLGGPDAGQFQRLTGEATDCTATMTLDAGETCELRARFDPTTTGAKSATLTVDSDAADVGVALSGSGIQTELSRSPVSLAFGSRDVDDGATGAQESTVTNTGSESVSIDSVDLIGQFELLTGQGADCTSATTLTAGQTCKVRVRFDPVMTGPTEGTVTVRSNAADVTVTLTGTGTQLMLAPWPSSLSFGSRDVDDGPAAEQVSTVSNGGTEIVDVDGVTLAGANPGQFERLTGSVDDCTAATTLDPGESCDVRVRFDPTSRGAKSTTLTVESNAPDASVEVSGTGIDTELTASPGALAFGARDIDNGPTATQTSTVTNTGTLAVDVTGAGLTANGGSYAVLTGAAGDCTAATSLSPGQSCSVRVRFDPGTVGAKPSSFEIASNAPTVAIALSGTGTQTLVTRSPASLAFGSQDIDAGPTAARESTVTNAGTEPVTLAGVTVTGSDAGEFARVTGEGSDCAAGTVLAANETCDVRVAFDPTATGPRTADVAVDAQNAADLAFSVSGTGIQAALSRGAGELAFGAQDIDAGPTAVHESTVTNVGTEPVGIDAVGLSGGDAGHFERLTGEATDCDAGRTLAAGETCRLRARFDPSATGARSATLTVDSSAEDVAVALGGTGTQTELALAPAALAFGARNLGEGPSAAQEAAVRNSGTEPVTIGLVAIDGAGATQFLALGGLPSDCGPGRTLRAGEECRVRTIFDPSSPGDKAATLTVKSNAADVTSALSGVGSVTRLVLGSGPARASQTARRRFRVQLSALGGTVDRATLTLSRANGARIARIVVTNVSARRTVTFRLRRALRQGRYTVTATAPPSEQVGPATRVYRLR